jgi:biopolymer transport protein ExbD
MVSFRKREREVPGLNTAALPDLIFTVLFFFMIVTHMRSETPIMKIEVPQGTELTKPQHRRYITNLYIGSDKQGNSRIQIGNSFVPVDRVGDAIQTLRNRINDDDRPYYVVSIRADKNTPMGVITDVKEELRRVGALKIRYNATEKNERIKK